MRAERTPDPARDDAPGEADHRTILGIVVAEHPAQVHVDDLQRLGDFDTAELDDVILDLNRWGIFHLNGEYIGLTMAAVRFHEFIE